MDNKGNRYDEFKADAMRLVREGGRSVNKVAKDLGSNLQTLRNWMGEDKKRQIPDKTRIIELEAQLRAEKRKTKDLEETVDILKKAAAFFCATIILKEGKADSQSEIIRRLNQTIRGWTNYHRHVVASQTFSYINNTLYHLLQQWAKHRHLNKNQWWRLNKYWHERNGKRWMFMTDEYSLINLRRIEIIRHPKLQISKNPFIHEEYFAKRKMKLKLLCAARNGEEMLEPYERETLTYGS